MKFKKIVSAVLASVIAAGMCAANAFAVEDGQATYCFDTNACIADFQKYGSVDVTGMKLSHTDLDSKNGNGCLVVSETNAEIPEEKYGGFYIEAATLGLENFKNCTIEMSVKLCEGAEGYAENLALYSDGIIFLNQPAAELSSSQWTTITLTLPDGAANTKVGFTIPTFKIYDGDILYIDDFAVTKDGKLIENKGDYEVKKVAAEDAASTGQSVVMTILLVVLILAIVGGIGLIVSSAIRKFT